MRSGKWDDGESAQAEYAATKTVTAESATSEACEVWGSRATRPAVITLASDANLMRLRSWSSGDESMTSRRRRAPSL